MAKIISGKEISADMKVEMKKKMDVLLEKGVAIGLTVVQVGDDPASSVYVRNKAKACEFVGITSDIRHLPATTTEEELSGGTKTMHTGRNCRNVKALRHFYCRKRMCYCWKKQYCR